MDETAHFSSHVFLSSNDMCTIVSIRNGKSVYECVNMQEWCFFFFFKIENNNNNIVLQERQFFFSIE